MLSFVISIMLLATTALLVGLYGLRRYRTLLNPLTIFAGYNIGIITLLSSLNAYSKLDTASYTAADLALTAQVTLAQVAGVFLAFRLSGHLPAQLFGKVICGLGLASDKIAHRFNILKFVLLLAAAVGAFVALALVGGGGLRWLINTRAAYLSNRAGAGPFFAAFQWFLALAQLYYLWSRRPRGLKLTLLLGLFATLAYFSGSKNYILLVFVIGLVYYQFLVKPISAKTILALGFLLFLGILGLVMIQSPEVAQVMGSPLGYFGDYFNTTTLFLARFDEFGFRYGAAWLSSFWFYVPRALYPDKPFEYGFTLIHAVLFPGAAAIGNTPGALFWSMSYLDFGVVGVFLFGLEDGLWKKAAYEHYLEHKKSFFAFVFMMQFSLWPVLIFAPLPIVLTITLALSFYFRLVLRLKPKRPELQPTAEFEVA